MLGDCMSKSIALGAVALSLARPVSADPVLEMMWGQSKDGPLYAYEMAYTVRGSTAVAKIDPSQPSGQRLELVSPSDDTLSDDFRDSLEEIDAEANGDIWCADFAEMVPEDASKTEENDTSVTYTFTPIPEADADKNEQKMIKQLDGVVTVDKSDGAVLAFNMTLPKPYKPALVAKIDSFKLAATCDRAPDGRTYVERFNFDIAGSAMMQSFEESVSRQITELLEP